MRIAAITGMFTITLLSFTKLESVESWGKTYLNVLLAVYNTIIFERWLLFDCNKAKMRF